MDRIFFEKSAIRFQFYKKWLCSSFSVDDALNCVSMARADSALCVFDYLELEKLFKKFICNLEV